MLKNIAILTRNDFVSAFRNKSFYLVFFVPLFIFLSLRLADKTGAAPQQIKLGLVHGLAYPTPVTKALATVPESVELRWLKDPKEAADFLRQNQVDAVLEASDGLLSLLVLRQESPSAQAAVQTLAALQKRAEKANPDWISQVKSLREGNIQKQTLPTWILMAVLLVAFIILPAQVADEKEKRQILAMLQAPIHEGEWIAAKILMGVGLSLVSILLLQSLSQVASPNLGIYVAFVIVGTFCFCAFGIFLGLLCRTQASARTLGVVFYLPLMMPAALSDFSTQMSGLLPLLPSYQFYGPIQRFFFEDESLTKNIFAWIYLLSAGSILFGCSLLFLKKRWRIS